VYLLLLCLCSCSFIVSGTTAVAIALMNKPKGGCSQLNATATEIYLIMKRAAATAASAWK